MNKLRKPFACSFPEMADDRVLPISEFAKVAGISPITLRRRIADREGPTITQVSKRRIGIRVRHGREWLDSRAQSKPD